MRGRLWDRGRDRVMKPAWRRRNRSEFPLATRRGRSPCGRNHRKSAELVACEMRFSAHRSTIAAMSPSTIRMKTATTHRLALALIAAALAAAGANTFAQPASAAKTYEQLWAQEGRYWAVEQLCNGEEGLQVARRATNMTAPNVAASGRSVERGWAIADQERRKALEAIKVERVQDMCREVTLLLASLIATRAEMRMLAEEAGRRLRWRREVDQIVLDRMVHTSERSDTLMNQIMEAAARAGYPVPEASIKEQLPAN